MSLWLSYLAFVSHLVVVCCFLYCRYAALKGWRYEALEVSTNDAGGLREASASISGLVRCLLFLFLPRKVV